jgi:hypothetical protein
MIRSAFTPMFTVFSASRTRHGLLTALLAGAVVFAAGCGKTGGPNNTVKGKVTLDGQVVAGEVVFIASDGKEYASSLVTGIYSIPNIPKGEATVLVKPPSAGVGGIGGKKAETPKVKDKAGGQDMAAGMEMGVPPPAKYSKKENGIKKTITGKSLETIDIELTK